MSKTFLAVNFGCRVNMAETNQWSQILIDQGFTPLVKEGQGRLDLILVNTCSITKKGEKESINKIKFFCQKYPTSKIYISGCANFDKV